MKKLHDTWGRSVHFVDVLVRQAHPGPGARAYRTFGEKMADAGRYRWMEAIAWPVLVDDLQGTVHQCYGTLPAPSYLIDIEGRVAFYNLVTHAPTLDRAIVALLDQGGRGIVEGGIDRTPHMLASLVDGWRGLRRGLPDSRWDLGAAAPGMPSAMWLGHQLRPLLVPIALRARPLPPGARAGLVAGAGLIALALVRAAARATPRGR